MITDPAKQKEFFEIDAETPEEFMTKFNETFIRKDKINVDKGLRQQISGAALGTEMTNFYRFFKDKGIDFTEEEKAAFLALPSHKNEKLIEAAFEKTTGTYLNQIKELEGKAGQGNDEKIKNLEEDKLKLTKKVNELESAWKTTGEQLETEKKNTVSTLRTFKISTLVAEAEKGVKLKQKMTEAERLGWDAAKTTRLKHDIGEKDDLETFNAAGDRIPSKNKAGQFLNATEALQDLANELGLAEVNPHGGKPAPVNQQQQTKTKIDQAPTGQTILLHGKPVQI